MAAVTSALRDKTQPWRLRPSTLNTTGPKSVRPLATSCWTWAASLGAFPAMIALETRSFPFNLMWRSPLDPTNPALSRLLVPNPPPNEVQSTVPNPFTSSAPSQLNQIHIASQIHDDEFAVSALPFDHMAVSCTWMHRQMLKHGALFAEILIQQHEELIECSSGRYNLVCIDFGALTYVIGSPISPDYSCSSMVVYHTPYLLSLKDYTRSDADKAYINRVRYRQLIGKLKYWVTGTRMDLCYGVNFLSRFIHNPGIKQWQALLWIARYISTYDNPSLNLLPWSDSD